MKKLYVLLLIIITTFTITACGNKEKEKTEKEEDIEQEESNLNVDKTEKEDEVEPIVDSVISTRQCIGEIDGSKTIINYIASDGIINKIELEMTFTSEQLEMDLNELSDYEKKLIIELMKVSVLHQLGLEQTAEGVEITVDITDVLIAKFTVDLNIASDETLNSLGWDLSIRNLDINSLPLVDPIEGFVCEK